MLRYFKEKSEWRMMKKAVFDHPYFDVKEHRLSESAAERLLRKHPPIDFKEALRRARMECGIPEPGERAQIYERTKREGIRSIHAPRKIAIAFIVVALLAGFFTLTKPGIALAQGIYEIIVRVIDSTLKARNIGMPNDVEPIDFSMLPPDFSGPEEVANLTGRAIVVPAEEDGELVKFSTDILETSVMIVRSYYAQGDGRIFRITQTIHNDNMLWAGASSAETDKVDSITLTSGITVYLSQMEDGTVFAAAYGAGYNLNVASNDLSLRELQELVERIRIIE